MLEILVNESALAISFTTFLSDARTDKDKDLVNLVEASLPPILRAFILSSNTMGNLILEPVKAIVSNISPGSLSMSDIADLLELAALTIRSTDLALDLFLDTLQPNAPRFMTADVQVAKYLLRNLMAIAVEHIEEANSEAKRLPGILDLKLSPKDKDGSHVDIDFRIDATGTPR
ncbi:hypothetical protein ACHAPK_009932 [Fusarium culmorum]